MNHGDDIQNGVGLSKRQRLLNIMRTTRDVYVPTVATTLSQLKSEAGSTLKNYYEHSGSTTTGNGGSLPPKWPVGMRTIVFPSYTRVLEENRFESHIRGVVYTPGLNSRKSRLLLSVCRQLVRPRSTADKALAEEQFEAQLEDSQSSLDSSSTSSSSQIGAKDEETLRTRIAGFLYKYITGVPIDIKLSDGANPDVVAHARTDSWGNYDIKITTDFEPSDIKVAIDITDGDTVSCPVNHVQNSGVALISDIDDTIKHTGVTGDKRSIFCNVFVNDFATWTIPGMSLWYNTLRDSEGVDFFYVSNAPYQIYPILQDYISKQFPSGPLFLKQYSGNLLSSLMTSSAKRKIGSIISIIKDFPAKKFILVGDSGERDLEAYTEAAKLFPDQIIGIYIRCCKDSMSDFAANSLEVMKELNHLIQTKYLSEMYPDDIQNLCDKSANSLNSPSVAKSATNQSEVEQASKRAPEIPARKPELTREQLKTIYDSRKPFSLVSGTPPPPPPRKKTRSKIYETYSPLSIGATNDETVYCTPSSQNDYGAYSSFFDSRADSWRGRVLTSILELKECGVKARFMFFSEPEVCLEDSFYVIRKGQLTKYNGNPETTMSS
ncbi:LAMI_0F09582g1_1 [Lachancea mirantina]|uniref:LAMI_0F09582g1_1 n=1 Tax=Lachancea mirantina TaxID=1230905 RepID=A0A1G4K191_9SACH|nr:LAMI_0F09582g1_1 [Lachancea mirantina]